MTTPLPDRCSPSVWAVKASSGIDDCTVTIDLSARSRLTPGPRFGRPACGSPRRGFSVIGPILSVEKARYNTLLRQSGSRNSRAGRNTQAPRHCDRRRFYGTIMAANVQSATGRGVGALLEHRHEVLPVGALAEAGDDSLELGDVDEAKVEGDFLGAADLGPLALLYGPDEAR